MVNVFLGAFDPLFLYAHLLSWYLEVRLLPKKRGKKTTKLLAECLLCIAATHYANKAQRI